MTVYLSDVSADGGQREIWRKNQNSDSSVGVQLTNDETKNNGEPEVQWEIYQTTLKQDIEKMVEEDNCDVLKKYFDNAFELQQSGSTGNPHAALVLYIAGKRSDAGCQN